MSAVPAPWLVDGKPDLWVRPSVFARIIKRSRVRVVQMLQEGTLEKFNYPTYRDPLGGWFIRISQLEFELVSKSVKSSKSA